MPDLCTFDDITPNDRDLVGGKALSLGLLARAGLPVPPGFCITTEAYRRRHLVSLDGALGERLAEAYRRLGEGPVAVRSSATAEDATDASFAGQQETILGVEGLPAVREAVARCWASLDSERAQAYRRRQGISDDRLAMAVVVQRLVPAEVAGVLFTRDPLDATGRRMLVEAAWGLGESVVSGEVMPDRYHLDRDTGKVMERHLAVKTTQRTLTGTVDVPADRRSAACLSDTQLSQLAELGRRVEAVYGEARDVEWAYADGRFWLLQARPITAGGAAEREQVRQEEITALRRRAEPGGTIWARYNLAEVLPAPTPMSWAIVRRLMSGRGGFGLMYRDLGFDPDPALDEDGVFDLICGRPYCNLSREPRLQFHRLPLRYPWDPLKAEPRRALYPTQLVFDSSRAGAGFWLRLPFLLPAILVKSLRCQLRVQRLRESFGQRFRAEMVPALVAALEDEQARDLTTLPTPALLDHLETWIRRTLHDFARDSLKATALASVCLGTVERALRRLLPADRVKEALGRIAAAMRPQYPDEDLASAIRALAHGSLDRATFLKRFGHRCRQEMELSQPRWSEDPAAVDRLIAQTRGSSPAAAGEGVAGPPGPERLDDILAGTTISPLQRAALDREIALLHAHLELRELAKHYLMRGYAVIRRILLELDRRFGLNGGIFFLVPEELPRLAAGEDLGPTITQRRRRRAMALSLEVPPVVFSDDLEAIGRPLALDGAATWQGTPLSAGVAEGPALVLEEPTDAPALDEPFVLVCPSTDPAWVPLFTRACGLVMETGGVLSHGAIVAREFGLPAIAGIAGIHRQLRTGQWLRIDGGTGQVALVSASDVRIGSR
ncbi:MAG: PEP-utilizing enzyme [Gemmataceae bacterium]|nr:PEP-utilizing enzyme [Gemmataceae bacterium]MDW8266556.1 PEP/pyruvate-binding domain-containing protein [Gemmataceae bacterium]